MTDAAMTSASPYAQVRVREPAGDRTFGETPTIGGEGADVVVPGSAPGAAIQIERRKGVWVAHPVGDSRVRFDGRPLATPRDLRKQDVIAVGDAQVIVTDASRTLLRLDVCHLVGNATISPASAISVIAQGESDDDVLIQAPRVAMPSSSSEPQVVEPVRPKLPRPPRSRRFWAVCAMVAFMALLLIGLVSQLNTVSLDLDPLDARVRVPGTLVVFHSGQDLLLLPGTHVVRAEHDGYIPAQVELAVGRTATSIAHLRLAKLPGTLRIDTGGVPATISVDGTDSGTTPSALVISAGTHTITLRAPRYVDYISTLEIQGAGAVQDLRAKLQPSWGTLQITTIPAGAHVSVDDADNGVSPAVVDAPSGVRQIRITAPNFKAWESSVVLKAGEALNVGPITLGQPDAHLTLTSVPNGAEVTIGGVFRGHTPLEADLPTGIEYELVVNAPGYATWSRSVFAESGKKVALSARLESVGGHVTIQGTPDGAQLLIDGEDRGRTPQSLSLSATDHRIEVRKPGWITYKATVTPSQGLDRTVQYKLVPENRAFALSETASTIYTQIGYQLRMVPTGNFSMGSERREQGRRPNEGFRKVILQRPFYIGVTEVTNEQFRKFHPDHNSGFVDRHTIDLDDQAVTDVSWNEAAEYCNWMSRQDNLPLAYEKKNDDYVLRRPVTIGYRLPTEAEWEYAARYAGPGQFRRFAWGDELPVSADVGNLAGSETGNSLPASLPGYKDDYPVVAPVGRFKATSLGLQDMSGNVSEWVNDYYMSYVDTSPVTDPLGPDDGTRHVIRGANWKSAAATDLRLAWRDGADGMSNTLGFRVVRYAE